MTDELDKIFENYLDLVGRVGKYNSDEAKKAIQAFIDQEITKARIEDYKHLFGDFYEGGFDDEIMPGYIKAQLYHSIVELSNKENK